MSSSKPILDYHHTEPDRMKSVQPMLGAFSYKRPMLKAVVILAAVFVFMIGLAVFVIWYLELSPVD